MNECQNQEMPLSKDLTVEEAKKIMKKLGKAEGEFATSLTAQLYWVIKEANSGLKVRNGSAFFLDIGEGPFGITACHVINALNEARLTGNVVACQIGRDMVFDLGDKNSIIDSHDEIDIATFRITKDEIRSIGKNILTGYQETWPPNPPTQGKGVYFCGFAGSETIWLSQNLISFGATLAGGVASSISDRDISVLIEREYLIDVIGKRLPPEDFDFRGISGGPLLTVVENRGLRLWRLAGVIYQGPNPYGEPNCSAIEGLQIIRARRTDFILSNGKLNTQLWNSITHFRR